MENLVEKPRKFFTDCVVVGEKLRLWHEGGGWLRGPWSGELPEQEWRDVDAFQSFMPTSEEIKELNGLLTASDGTKEKSLLSVAATSSLHKRVDAVMSKNPFKDTNWQLNLWVPVVGDCCRLVVRFAEPRLVAYTRWHRVAAAGLRRFAAAWNYINGKRRRCLSSLTKK